MGRAVVMTTRDSDAVIADRVRAWLAVGGSWDAIAVAHGLADVTAFRRRVGPLITTGVTRPVQLKLFGTAA